MPYYDHIIIGSGADGAAGAYRLTQNGKSILLLEKGEALLTDGSTLDLTQGLRLGAFENTEPWRDGKGKRFVPEEYFNLGGKTKWYGAALLRYGEHEFAADAAHQCLAWPIGYRDLQPFYDEAETLLGVRRFEVERDLRVILDRLQLQGGWRAEPLPLGLSADILDHPHEAGHFDGFASAAGLKADAQRSLLDRVAGRLTIATGRAVTRLLGADGDIRHVIGVGAADGQCFHAGKVLLAAGAMHTPRLLQRYMETSGLARLLPNYRLVGVITSATC